MATASKYFPRGSQYAEFVRQALTKLREGKIPFQRITSRNPRQDSLDPASKEKVD